MVVQKIARQRRRGADMLKIFLCDDDMFFLSLETDLIERIIKEDGLLAAIAGKATSISETLTFLKNNPGHYLVFLDLDFGKNQPNGIDISVALKKQTRNIHIVFTSNHHEMAMNVLKSGAEPFCFLENGTDMKLLSSGFRRYIHMALHMEQEEAGSKDTVCLTVGLGETVEIDVSDILYLEAEKGVSHGITYHTVNGSKITVLGTLGAEAKRLGENFLRVHRSFLVAKKQMIGLHGGFLILSDQRQIPCSLRMQTEVKRWLQKK